MAHDENEIFVSNNITLTLRLGLSFFGFAIMIFAGRDLIIALSNFSIASLFLLFITFTGVVLGAFIAIGFLLSPQTNWKISSGKIEIINKLGKNLKTNSIMELDIIKAEIETKDWETRADTYLIKLITNTGKTFYSPDFSNQEDAIKALNFFLKKA